MTAGEAWKAARQRVRRSRDAGVARASFAGLFIERHRKELELVGREGAYADLVGQVAAGQLDAMLADAAVPANLARSLHASILADSGMSFVAARPHPLIAELEELHRGSARRGVS